MILQRQRADTLECLLNGLNLLQDIHAVDILFDHALDAANVAFDAFQSIDNGAFLLRVKHVYDSFYPVSYTHIDVYKRQFLISTSSRLLRL